MAPPAELDRWPYEAALVGEWLVLTGAPSARVGVAATKAFRMELDGTVRIRYGMTNRRAESVAVAPWEVTRVRRTGVTFFPLGARTHDVPRHPPLPFVRIGDVAWIDHSAPLTGDRKLYADSGGGHLAHAADGVVFVKKFEQALGAERAAGEAEIEIYANAEPAYVELEEQGAVSVIAPGASVTWNVEWRLVPLPQGVTIAIGEPALVDLVTSALNS